MPIAVGEPAPGFSLPDEHGQVFAVLKGLAQAADAARHGT